jgi:cell surface protein SprA
MKVTAPEGRDYSDLDYLEIWLRRKVGNGGKMHVDLGEVSENFYNPWARDSLHTEDRDGDGKLDPETENTGLDGVFTGEAGDDPYDDWDYREGDCSQVNGTERNPRSIPDTEDLDGDGVLDTGEAHFRLSFDLDRQVHIARESGEWKLYRVPLADAEALSGSPSWESIRYGRFFFTETDSPAVYQIAYFRLTGSTWENEGLRNYWDMSPFLRHTDETFEIGAKNTRDDPDYVPPYDPGTTAQGYPNLEQSMVLSLVTEVSWHCGTVHKRLGGVEDLTSYDSLSFYCYGGNRPFEFPHHVFVRLGSDSLNFYEYGIRVMPDWHRIGVDLDDLRAVESHLPKERTMYGHTVSFRGGEIPGGWISIYGDPDLASISWLGAGLVVSYVSPPILTRFEVWLDDIQVTALR